MLVVNWNPHLEERVRFRRPALVGLMPMYSVLGLKSDVKRIYLTVLRLPSGIFHPVHVIKPLEILCGCVFM